MAEIIDNRRNKRLLDELGDWTPDASKNPNRLPNVRWKLGEEPDAEGNNKEDGWVNVKLDVTEDDSGPSQKHLLKGGPKLKLLCHICGQETRAAASRDAKSVLDAFGYVNIPEFENKDIVIAACPAGHIQQVVEDFVYHMIAED